MTSLNAPIMQITNLSKDFKVRNRKTKFTAVNAVTLDLYPGEVLGVVGESGSGKTTLARCAFGITNPTSGSVSILGKSISEMSEKERLKIKSNLGFVFQDPVGSLNPRMSILDVVSEPLVLRGDSKAEILKRVNFLIERVGLSSNVLHRKAHELSGGQCQRVAIARALATNPKIVLLDEPTSSLDLSVQAQILNLLEELRRDFGLTYFMISHNLDVVGHLSDRVAVMRNGEILEVGKTQKMLEDPATQYTRDLINVHSLDLNEDSGLPANFNLDLWQDGPLNKWAFQHISDFLPVAQISPAGKALVLKEKKANEIEALNVLVDQQDYRFDELLKATDTDAIVVLKDGLIRYEKYFNGMQMDTPHLLQSVSKSILGALFGKLIKNGLVDPKLTLGHYLPELKGGVFGEATVAQALDMTISLEFSEDYLDPNSEMARLDRACGWRTNISNLDKTLRSFLPTLKANGAHGKIFQYCSANSDALAWLAAKVSGKDYAKLLQDEIWQPMGATFPASITLDKEGLAVGNGGISCTARDLALFGELVLNGGEINSKQVLSKPWVLETMKGVETGVEMPAYLLAANPKLSYKNHWWLTGNQANEIYAVGIYGQYLWIDPSTKTVIAKFSSLPIPIDPVHSKMHLALFRAISGAL